MGKNHSIITLGDILGSKSRVSTFGMNAIGCLKYYDRSITNPWSLLAAVRLDHHTGGGQKVCTSRVVLPVADNIFK